MPFKLNAGRRHHIPKQKFKVTNSLGTLLRGWAVYDASLRQRGSLTVWVTEKAITAWTAEPRTTRGGQRTYSALAILTVLTLRVVFRLALRQTEGLIGSVIGLLGLDLAVPDRSTLSRRAETLEVPRSRTSAEPVHLLVDSTGLKLCGTGEWLHEKHGTKMRRSWRKLHLGMDAGTGKIVASLLTAKDVDDDSQVGFLLDQVEGPLASFTSDGAYDRRASPPASPPAIPKRRSSCRHAQRPRRMTRPRPHQHSAAAISSTSQGTAAWPGKRHPPTPSVPEPRRACRASSR